MSVFVLGKTTILSMFFLLRLIRGLTDSFNKEMLRVLREVEQDILVFSANPIAVIVPIRITID